MKRFFYHLARLTLALVFVYAGAVKMQDVVAFAGHVAAYQILPYAMNYLVASTLPYVEFLAGVMLLLNARVRPALLVIGAMTLVFMAALVSVLLRGMEIDCGCFDPGGGQDVTAGVALLRDIALMALVVLVWWLRSRLTAREE
ncbi:MAG: MauE/DoxX family redox-associated membrane protein [Desulfuromonadales bacterium]|nr:MauE/DoxX family redox-associated membrane protein [Desulfuromonadales bacterium]